MPGMLQSWSGLFSVSMPLSRVFLHSKWTRISLSQSPDVFGGSVNSLRREHVLLFVLLRQSTLGVRTGSPTSITYSAAAHRIGRFLSVCQIVHAAKGLHQNTPNSL